MASPQLEDGYTRIANELLDALVRADLTATQLRIMLAIVRETYGFNRKTVTIGYQALSTRYGIHRPLLIREMAALVDRQYLIKTAGTTNMWQVQKDYTQWSSSLPAETSPRLETSLPQGQGLVSAGGLGTSLQPWTTSKTEKDIKDNAVGVLMDLGLTRGQAVGFVKRNSITVEAATAWRDWLPTCTADKPLSVLIGHLKDGRTLPPPVYGKNGNGRLSAPVATDTRTREQILRDSEINRRRMEAEEVEA